MEMKGLYRAYEIEQEEKEKQSDSPTQTGLTAGDRSAFGDFADRVNNPAS